MKILLTDIPWLICSFTWKKPREMWTTKVTYSRGGVGTRLVYILNIDKMHLHMNNGAKLFHSHFDSLIRRHSYWPFSLSGTVFWNQYPALWLVPALSLRLHSTHCASLLEGRITMSILGRTQWTSSVTGWGTTRLDQPFRLQITDLFGGLLLQVCNSTVFSFLITLWN